LSWVGSYGRIKRKKMMKNYKDTYQNTLIASGKQNFQGEVTSGFVMKLWKLTLENIREEQKEKQRKGEPCYHLEML
jgi:hypothetical protein